MSMLCNLYRVDPGQVAQLRLFPEAIGELLGLTAAPPPRTSLWARILVKPRATQKAAPPVFAPIAPSHTFELDGAWHILHFLFSGRSDEGPWPASFLVSGGTEIGPDQGYGPARLVDTKQALELAAFLDAQTHEALHAAYDPAAIEAAGIYWQTSATPEERRQQLDDLWEVVARLRAFVRSTANAADSVMVSIY